MIRYGTDGRGRPVKKAIVYTRAEHGIPIEKVDKDAVGIARRLESFGFSAFIVGGAVRDLIAGNRPKDFDIVTDATPSRIKKIFRNSRIIGRRFRLVHVIVGPKIFEVSTFRSTREGSVGNSFGAMDEDVMRRDFTMNALYYDPIKEQVIDYVGGVRDIRTRALRPVIPLDRIFVEDPVRMERAVKYSVMTGSKIPHSLKAKIKKSAGLLSKISPSRLTEELLKIINSGHAHDIVEEAMDLDVYDMLQPAAARMMRESRAFRSSYMESLSRLDSLVSRGGDARLGGKLRFMIEDFARSIADWKAAAESCEDLEELYSRAWSECRRFVLPMNPPRAELDFAVRTALRSLGAPARPPRKRRGQGEGRGGRPLQA